ncbi:hypothetical protein B0A58_09005 [Flavobacterium branchiophilum NBRC 15030 = ATCC 35035]|nr:hypothetical protein B0A58_09005 [Flavobacterium branchiophilum NBRC 15030 = ATCC 35035]
MFFHGVVFFALHYGLRYFALGIAVEILLEAPQPQKGGVYCINIVSECGYQKRLFHNIIFHLEFNERCLQRIARPLANAQYICRILL